MQQENKELFQDYEVRNWNYSPRLYKILGAAALLNLLGLFVIGQTNMLTTRGCDSPMVSRVCQVIDTIYVGSKMLGTDGEFVSKDYEKTELEDADITYIDVSGVEPPLAYPEGYFALANPEDQFTALENPTDFSTTNSISGIPGFPTTPPITNGADLLSQPQVTPTPNNDAITGIIPDKPFSMGNDNPIARTSPIRNRKFPRGVRQKPLKYKSPPELPKFNDETTAENKTKDKTEDKQVNKTQEELKSDPVADVEINKKPFEDLGDFVNDSLAKKEVDLNKPFRVVLDGVITVDGKLDAKKSKFRTVEGDEKMSEVARQAIEAVGNSGFLAYLKNNGVDVVTFTLVQDDEKINAIIISDQKTPEKAGTTASGLNTMLSALKIADANGWKKLDDNSRTLIENSKVTNEGKKFVLNFALPKQAAQEIITKTLKERAEKRAAQPKSSADVSSNSNTATAK